MEIERVSWLEAKSDSELYDEYNLTLEQRSDALRKVEWADDKLSSLMSEIRKREQNG